MLKKNLGKGIAWGYMGYIFKKKLLNLKDILNFYRNVENDCFFVDDHWLTGYCYYKKITSSLAYEYMCILEYRNQ